MVTLHDVRDETSGFFFSKEIATNSVISYNIKPEVQLVLLCDNIAQDSRVLSNFFVSVTLLIILRQLVGFVVLPQIAARGSAVPYSAKPNLT